LSFPQPVPGQVIRYGYLWDAEHRRGQEEGVKDRPCAVVMVVSNDQGNEVVTVLDADGVEAAVRDAIPSLFP